MNLRQLRKRLEEEGCSPLNYAVGSRASDAFCLIRESGIWKVCYSERGRDSDPIFTSASESEACGFFLDHMCRQPNQHLVGTFGSDEEAKTFEAEVARAGARPFRNDVPAAIHGTPRFRVFVAGKDIHIARPLMR